jgi:glycosyltransferase involved in cell wall biosynthesis
MAHAIVEVLRNPAKSAQMCAAGRALAETFDWRLLGKRYRELIWELIK